MRTWLTKSRVGAAALALSAGMLHAQSTAPRFYMWAEPSEPNWNNPQFVPMINVYLGDPTKTGTQAAQEAGDTIQRYLQNGWIGLDRVAITFNGLGSWRQQENGDPIWSIYGLYAIEDAVTPEPQWHHGLDPTEQRMKYIQPWMNHARPRVAEWMADFLEEYQNLQLPRPARFHFDTEVNMWDVSDENATRLLEGLARDQRWVLLEVPGFPGKTMQDLYEEAIDHYGWPDYPLDDPVHCLVRDERPDGGPTGTGRNRKYFLWYLWVSQVAVDAVMNKCLYQAIRTTWPADPPLISNWEECVADGRPDTFGWYPSNAPGVYWPGPTTHHHEYKAVRGMIRPDLTGAQHYEGDLVEPNGDRSIWLFRKRTTSADFSAPLLYPFTPFHSPVNYYLPPGTMPPSAQQEILDASFRNQRHDLEAVLNTPASGGPGKVTPWMIFPGEAYWTNKPGYTHTITDEQVRRQLALLRHKDIREAVVWWAFEPRSYADFKNLYDQVYTPNLSAFSVAEGCQINGNVTLDTLHFTLRNHPATDPTDETIRVAASGTCDDYAATLQTTFVNLDPHLGDRLKLNLECKVSRANLSGRVYVRTDSDDVWTAIEIGDYSSDPYLFGFFAPAHDDGWYETRRTFTIPASLIKDDALHIRVVIVDVPGREPPDPFSAAFDLVQVYWSEGATGPSLTSGLTSSPAGRPQGADLTHDGVVDIRDLLRFNDYYARAVPAADFNDDGVIDTADVADFAAAYTNP